MSEIEHFDVLIVGAGISGIGAALPPAAPNCPGKSYAILEARATTSAAPGTCSAIRASARTRDMYTLGYRFKPWTRAEGDRRRPVDPRTTCDETAREYGIDQHIRFGHRVARADVVERPTRAGRSTVDAPDGETPCTSPATSCSCARGYYNYDEGYTPEFAGARATSRARIVHPQHWPEDLDYAGKRVVVIGSGATAVTLVPGDGRRRRRT